MYEMEYRDHEFNRDKALREEIMAGRDKFFMQSGARAFQVEEREKFLSSLLHFGRG